MGSTNFVLFNPSQANQETDAQYLADATRTGGAGVDAIWPSPSANKTLYQLACGMYSLMTMMANKGFTTFDTNPATLTAVMANLLTTADIASGLQSVPWASTLTFNAAKYSGFETTLQGATSFSVAGQSAGQVIGIIWVQDGVGGRTVTFPGNVVGGAQPDPTPGITSVQLFKVDAALNLDAVGPVVSANGMRGLAVNALTLMVAGAAPVGQVLTGNGTSYVPLPVQALSGYIDVTSSRSYGVVYQNTTGRSLLVTVSGSWDGNVGFVAEMGALVGSSSPTDLVAATGVTNGNGYCSMTFVVPAGWYYEVQNEYFIPNSTLRPLTLTSWIEAQ